MLGARPAARRMIFLCSGSRRHFGGCRQNRALDLFPGRSLIGKRSKLASMPYLDHAATTPMRPEAIDAVDRGDGASSATRRHCTVRAGAPRRRVEEAREQLAAVLGARPSEVIFTGGGTESDNLAVKGMFWARRDADPRAAGSRQRRRAPCCARRRRLARSPTKAPRSTWLEVDEPGWWRRAALRDALEADLTRVAVDHA